LESEGLLLQRKYSGEKKISMKIRIIVCISIMAVFIGSITAFSKSKMVKILELNNTNLAFAVSG